MRMITFSISVNLVQPPVPGGGFEPEPIESEPQPCKSPAPSPAAAAPPPILSISRRVSFRKGMRNFLRVPGRSLKYTLNSARPYDFRPLLDKINSYILRCIDFRKRDLASRPRNSIVSRLVPDAGKIGDALFTRIALLRRDACPALPCPRSAPGAPRA